MQKNFAQIRVHKRRSIAPMQNSQEGFYARSEFRLRSPQGFEIIFYIDHFFRLIIRLRSHSCSRFRNSHCAVEM